MLTLDANFVGFELKWNRERVFIVFVLLLLLLLFLFKLFLSRLDVNYWVWWPRHFIQQILNDLLKPKEENLHSISRQYLPISKVYSWQVPVRTRSLETSFSGNPRYAGRDQKSKLYCLKSDAPTIELCFSFTTFSFCLFVVFWFYYLI